MGNTSARAPQLESQPKEWRTVICGLPIIRRLLAGETVDIETFKVSLLPDDVLFNARPKVDAPSVTAPSGPSKMNATKLDSIVAQVPHKRHRTGVKPSRPGTYVQFSYACNKDCPRCQLEAYAAEEKQRREKLEALCAKMDRLAKYAHNTDCGVAAEKLKEFADELRSALLEEE